MKFKSNKKVVTAVTTFHRLRCIQLLLPSDAFAKQAMQHKG